MQIGAKELLTGCLGSVLIGSYHFSAATPLDGGTVVSIWEYMTSGGGSAFEKAMLNRMF